MMPCHTEAAPHIQNRFGKNSRECNADFCKIEDLFGYPDYLKFYSSLTYAQARCVH
jgi:uncharacterized protein (DUF1810 family)